MLSKKGKNTFGFTLIELLLVVAIIGILSSLAVVNLNQARAKARDAKRLSDIGQVRKALEVYYGTYGHYPNPECRDLAAIGGCNSIIYTGVGEPSWIPDLKNDLNIDIPDDPINNAQNLNDYDDYSGVPYIYLFTRHGARSADYDNYYYLIFRLEASAQIDTCNNNPWGSGWSCIGGGDVPPDPDA
ncbi:hypothetical protein C0580_04170 [Candidatus Parcubacteria bacterium]|nr:MAG: hypothetical protein C0580_04170 [Candidatus Parcubacteria bacterium]